MKKRIIYKISEVQVEYIQQHTFNMLYDKTMYWLYSERMPFLHPFLERKKKENVSLEDLLEYCKNQQIQVYPMTVRKNKLFTDIAAYLEMINMKRRGILIKSNEIAALIVEYTKYCLVNYPADTSTESV
ncbi:hypothetical protein SAMN04487770_12149 [Butyrivibrio sp. ob235]|uniref:hypothetical protein n=1 Tax=Butyrivibrio sp. ob235 TaxID=1761780 RepID=UPI0008BDE951|nr:hypothetical protein [Butyrivibrio sp. ob235]SEL93924.1 hypothetical protein SAMN04487770_12149 [Butyrivibrio sp. ob235]